LINSNNDKYLVSRKSVKESGRALGFGEYNMIKTAFCIFLGLAFCYVMGIICRQAGADMKRTVELTVEQKPQTYRVTAYCPCEKCCGKWSDGVTANGHVIQPWDRFVAADKRVPFGTRLKIPGYNNGNPVRVLDRGGAIKGNRLDVFFPTHQEALNWGVQNLEIEIL
jgi:3D (Asp-Asp-Asp) domain-containing protein